MNSIPENINHEWNIRFGLFCLIKYHPFIDWRSKFEIRPRFLNHSFLLPQKTLGFSPSAYFFNRIGLFFFFFLLQLDECCGYWNIGLMIVDALNSHHTMCMVFVNKIWREENSNNFFSILPINNKTMKFKNITFEANWELKFSIFFFFILFKLTVPARISKNVQTDQQFRKISLNECWISDVKLKALNAER